MTGGRTVYTSSHALLIVINLSGCNPWMWVQVKRALSSYSPESTSSRPYTLVHKVYTLGMHRCVYLIYYNNGEMDKQSIVARC